MKKLIATLGIASTILGANPAIGSDQELTEAGMNATIQQAIGGDLAVKMEVTVKQTVVKLAGMEIRPPFSELEQRMEMQLSDDFIDALRPFARDLGKKLDRMLDAASELHKDEAEEYIVRSIRKVLSQQDIKVSEMLSFEVLERALLIHERIQNMAAEFQPGIEDMRIRLLTRSIEMAKKKYADKDIAHFMKVDRDVDFAAFGQEYLEFLADLNKSVFDADIQFYIEKLSLRFYMYDLARDVNNQRYATEIVDLYEELPGYPDRVASDQSALRYIRSLRKLKKSVVQK